MNSGSHTANNSHDLYNGNIRYMQTAITNPETRVAMPMVNAYQYDQLNRLKESRSYETGLSANTWNPISYNNEYFNLFAYDANGNILYQERYKRDGATQIDGLKYKYQFDDNSNLLRNRLYHVNDIVADHVDSTDIDDMGDFESNPLLINTNNNYSYDEEGRLIKDVQEEIEKITWRVDEERALLVKTESRTGSSEARRTVKSIERTLSSEKKNLTFEYNSFGQRVAKHVYNNQTGMLEKSTYYLLDAQGQQLTMYEHTVDSTVNYYLAERNIYGSSRLGTTKDTVNMYNPDFLPSYGVLGNRNYELSNHLGNVLAVITDVVVPLDEDANDEVDGYQVALAMTADYSPFGVQLDGRTFESGSYRYGFQNQEKDDEIKGAGNSVNYTYRMHDPRLGRFFAVDPLFREYPHNSPYAFSENTVINAVELEGLERHYVFNSAVLSAEALNMIKTQSYSETEEFINGLVGSLFSTFTNLKYANDKLGKQFDDAPGFGVDGKHSLSFGNRAVKGSYAPNGSDKGYFTARLVIDNGNGTWSTQEVTVRDPKYIQKELKLLDNEINKLDQDLKKLKFLIKVEEWWTSTPTDKVINTSDRRDGVADAYFNLGQELIKSQTRRALPAKRKQASDMEATIENLKAERDKIKNTPLLEMGEVEPVTK